MRKFSSLKPYRPATSRIAGGVKKMIMDIMMDATDQLVAINPVAEDITDQIFDLSMYDAEGNMDEMFDLIDSLPVSMSDRLQMKSVIKQAIGKLTGSKFASNKRSFQNTSSFYKTQPGTDFDLYEGDMEEGLFAEDLNSFEEFSGDDYLYNNDGSLYDGLPLEEDDFSSEMMADDLYAGRRWDGKGNQKGYDKPPALDNTGCYTDKDWKAKGNKGKGTCYRLHNEYGSANAGEDGSKERAEYNKRWRQEWADSKSKERKGPLPGSKRWK
jgi:hypothetical protein